MNANRGVQGKDVPGFGIGFTLMLIGWLGFVLSLFSAFAIGVDPSYYRLMAVIPAIGSLVLVGFGELIMLTCRICAALERNREQG
ncbi:MAG TPA: hypothetical protein PLH21_02560 [Chiayiivirga sp.]|nr:hypothetical protein [Chiayiivirga sp.]